MEEATTHKESTIADSEDCCIECGLQIASQRQVDNPGCRLYQSCADFYGQEAEQK